MKKRTLSIGFPAAALLLAMTSPSGAKEPVSPVYVDARGLAVDGYDPVAYFKDGSATAGFARFNVRWMGVEWWFANEANRDAFKTHPERYAPQFGGYCAWAVGHGYTAKTDPNAWRIVEGKLYLNYNKDVQAKWEKDRDNWIRLGEKNWPSLHK